MNQSTIDENRSHFELRPLSMPRPGHTASAGLQPSDRFCFHSLDLRPQPDRIYAGFHNDCVRRKIRRAEMEGLEIRSGRSGRILNDFYRLQTITRRRQGAPVQSKMWFDNLSGCLGDRLLIRVAYKDEMPIASILTLTHGSRSVFKYACSDARFNALGGVQLLLWQVIREAKESGALELDLGRSDPANAGLIAFKDRWGAVRSDLVYLRGYRCPRPYSTDWHRKPFVSRFTHLPFKFLPSLGRALYRHFA